MADMKLTNAKTGWTRAVSYGLMTRANWKWPHALG